MAKKELLKQLFVLQQRNRYEHIFEGHRVSPFALFFCLTLNIQLWQFLNLGAIITDIAGSVVTITVLR